MIRAAEWTTAFMKSIRKVKNKIRNAYSYALAIDVVSTERYLDFFPLKIHVTFVKPFPPLINNDRSIVINNVITNDWAIIEEGAL